MDISKLPPELQSEVYKPGDDETYNIEVNIEKPSKEFAGDESISAEPNGDGEARIDLGRLLDDE